jgi:hypothetical protein
MQPGILFQHVEATFDASGKQIHLVVVDSVVEQPR